MDLPEIRDGVGLLLPKYALAACVRVCKDWQASFIPHLYASLDMNVGPEQIPTPMDLALYGHHLKELCLDFIHPEIQAIPVTCHNIQTLQIGLVNFKTKHGDYIERLLRSNPRIQHLVIIADHFRFAEIPPSFVRDTLLHCTALTKVALIGFELSKEDFSTLWTISGQLKELRIDGYPSESLEESIWELGKKPWPTAPKLELLDLSWIIDFRNPDAQVNWMGQYPSLKQLVWTFPNFQRLSERHPGDNFTETKFGQEWEKLFRSARCPLLTSVETNGPEFEDKYLQIMLEQSPALFTNLRIRLSQFPEPATMGWRRHFGTLVCLDLLPTVFEEHWVSQTILSSCPLLEKFVGTTLFLSDGSSADPWVCDKLRHLTIKIKTTGTPQMHDEILDRLIQLENLETLEFGATSDWFLPSTDNLVQFDDSLRQIERELQPTEEADHGQRLFTIDTSPYGRIFPMMPKQRWIQDVWPRLRHLDCNRLDGSSTVFTGVDMYDMYS